MERKINSLTTGGFNVFLFFSRLIKSGLQRCQQIEDPVTRNVLFCEKLSILLDVFQAGQDIIIQSLQDEEVKFLRDDTQEQKDAKIKKHNEKIAEVSNEITMTIQLFKEEHARFLVWIQNPIYGPDHPVGHKIMMEQKANFEKSVSALSKQNCQNDSL